MNELKLIDSHAHLDFPDYEKDFNEVIKRAKEAGITKLLTVGTTVESSRNARDLATANPFIYASAGVHPHEAASVTEKCYDEINTLTESDKVIAIGEVGLDYHYEHSPREVQREVFRRFIRLAKKKNLPLIVHTREAEEDTLSILKEEEAGKAGGVIHCFSGSVEMAKECLVLGFYISIPGIVTFPKATNIHEAVRAIPIERMLIETDSPFLAPVPYRGKRNEPAYVKMVAEKVAELKGLSLEDVGRITTQNAEALFRIGESTAATEIAYKIRNSLYLNITNRCTNRCPFCPKFKDYKVKGYYLELGHEPTTDEIIAAVGNSSEYREVVFCGFGEPLIRLDAVKEVSKWLKEKGTKVRINTDGLANRIHGRNILPELEGLVDSISVSLNADSNELYHKLCRPPFEDAWESVKEFIKSAKRSIPEVTASVVDLPNIDVDRCREIAEKELGVLFRLRPYNEVG